MPTLLLKLLTVFFAEVLSVWLLYRCRAVMHLSWANSDLIIFGLPFGIGFVAFAVILVQRGALHRPSAGRLAVAPALALGGAVASFCVGMIVGANLYGT